MLPDETLLKPISSIDLYGLRDKAAKGEKLKLDEIGRILLHLNQNRGYKSNRKANNEGYNHFGERFLSDDERQKYLIP